MSQKTYQELKEIQDVNLEHAQKSNPELFEREKDIVEKDIHDAIAISSLASDRKKGFVRYFPHDVIIEELDQRGKAASVFHLKKKGVDGDHLQCVLEKGAISQYDAQQNIAQAFGVALEDVSYAEPKDTNALSFSYVTIKNGDISTLENIKIPGVLLPYCTKVNRTIDPGSLGGNRYTILVRTEDPVDLEWLNARVVDLHVDGCINYFDIKKFGGYRLLLHKLGAYIVRGEYQRAIEELLFQTSPHDIALISDVRKKAKIVDHDIDQMIELYSQYPIIFRIELDFLKYLKEHPGDYEGALHAHQNHVKNWIFAYQAYLFNSYISGIRKQGTQLPARVPLMFSGGKEAIELYKPWLEKQSTEEFWRFGKDFIKVALRSKKKRDVKLYPDFKDAVIVPGGVIISFDLPAGANPDVVLMNMFELHEGEHVPEWVATDEIDMLKTLNRGSVSDIKKRMGAFLDRVE